MDHLEQQELLDLLTHPRETKHVEYKAWLNLKEDRGRAKLAKHAIAIANAGGGKIVLGMSEPKNAEESWKSEPRPDDVLPYSEDMVSSAIQKFADPMPECKLEYASHPTSGVSHAIIVVHGGLTEPVIAKKPYKKELIEHRCYIRKLGPPRSEEPKSALEWRELLDRCVRANRASLVEAIRGVVDGRLVAEPARPQETDLLGEFAQESRERWNLLINELEVDDPARLPHGRFEFCFSLPSVIALSGPKELNDVLDKARNRNHSSYGPFWQRSLESHEPYTHDGALEAWNGNPNERKSWWGQPFRCSFWRATSDGRFYHIEGLYEDSRLKGIAPGELFETMFPIRRAGSFLMFASEIAELWGSVDQVLVSGKYSGLKDRKLYNEADIWDERVRNRSKDDAITIGPKPVSASSVRVNLPEITHELLADLYQTFWFVELKPATVATQIALLKQRGY